MHSALSLLLKEEKLFIEINTNNAHMITWLKVSLKSSQKPVYPLHTENYGMPGHSK